MSLTRKVQAAVDDVFSSPELKPFAPVDDKDAVSFRRYYRGTTATECEVSVYRDKWWSKAGGNAYVELYCLNRRYQRLMGGCEQSWLAPDYSKPLCHFQYRTTVDARQTGFELKTTQDTVRFGDSLRAFLSATALPWFARLESDSGIEGFLRLESRWFPLAKWLFLVGRKDDAMQWFRTFLLELPRGIEQQLAEMAGLGLITPDAAQRLGLASLQEESVYARRIGEWCDGKPV